MKTTFFAAIIMISPVLLVGATVWEGVSAVVSEEELPGDYTIATSSFPKNAVVDIVNLENGKKARVVVADNLGNNSLLAKISRSAAGALNIRGTSCRIQIIQPPADIAFANFRLGPITTGAPVISQSEFRTEDTVFEAVSHKGQFSVAESETDPHSDIAADVIYAEAQPFIAEPEIITRNEPLAFPSEAEQSNTYRDMYSEEQTIIAEAAIYPLTGSEAEPQALSALAAEIIEGIEAPVYSAADAAAEAAPAVIENQLLEAGNAGILSMIPAEERLPQAPQQVAIGYENITPPLTAEPQIITSPAPSAFSPFQAPMIDQLIPGKWYVQVAAYTRADHVEDEIARIGPGYPLAIQNTNSDADPKFRVLLGPYDKSGSNAMLEHFKSKGYTDAFLRNRNED